MAQDIYVFQVLIPAGTTKAANFTSKLTIPPRTVEELEILTPPGPRGEVGWQIGLSGVPVIPVEVGQFIVTDDEVIHWPLEDYPDSGDWQFFGYNTGQFDHTIYIRILAQRVGGGRPSGSQPLMPGQVVAEPLTAAPSPVSSPTPPPPAPIPPPPIVPPVTPPPLPALPPIPTLPPPPALPSLPGLVPISGLPSPQPTPRPAAAGTYWRPDAVRFLIWNGAQQLFRIKQDGALVQSVNDGSGHWAQTVLGVGYVPGALVVDAASVQGQLQVYALSQNGSVGHFWQVAGQTTWSNEQIPNL